MLHEVACLIIFILFDDPDWEGGVLKDIKNDRFLVFVSCFGPFPQDFGQFKG